MWQNEKQAFIDELPSIDSDNSIAGDLTLVFLREFADHWAQRVVFVGDDWRNMLSILDDVICRVSEWRERAEVKLAFTRYPVTPEEQEIHNRHSAAIMRLVAQYEWPVTESPPNELSALLRTEEIRYHQEFEAYFDKVGVKIPEKEMR